MKTQGLYLDSDQSIHHHRRKRTSMRTVIYGLAITTFLISVAGSGQAQPLATKSYEVAVAQKSSPIISVVLPISATVWLNAGGGSTSGQMTGFDGNKKVMTLGSESMQLTKISKVTFDRKALTYSSDGTILIRGEDKAKATQKSWPNISASALQLKDSKLGQAQVNLDGVINPIDLRGIQSVAVKSVYVVDEIQFQSGGKMTIKVTAADR